jgi:hypothetical protein
LKARWLAVFSKVNPVFLMGVLFLIEALIITPDLSGTQLGRKTRAEFVVYCDFFSRAARGPGHNNC